MGIEDQILLEENELKPNRYVANVMLYAIPAFLLVELLNELNIFHVELLPMRVCCGILVICALLVQFMGRNQEISCKKNAKYWILTIVNLATLAITVVLSQWSELLIALPLTLAMQYHSNEVTRFSIAFALLIAAISAPLGVYLGVHQINYYEYLINTVGLQVDALSPLPDFDVMRYVLLDFLYISVPRCIIVGALALTAVYITRLTSSNIRNRAEVTYLSSMDVMTGVFNRLSYENKLVELAQDTPDRLICIYADADGLHELNNKFGHSAGDRLLKTCAKQLTQAFGEDTFRIGGDEFVVFVDSDDMDGVRRRFESMQAAMAERGYHISMGASSLAEEADVFEVIRTAEERMYDAKRAYYSSASHDRRKNRA